MQPDRAQQEQGRKYRMTKGAGAGDWILPGNDGKTLWRLMTYEDGPSHGVEGMEKDRLFWGVWKFIGRIESGRAIDLADFSNWDFWEGNLDSRAEAIAAVVKLSTEEES